MNAPQHGPRPATATIDAILSAASDETRETLRVLGELLGNEPATAISPTQFAIRHLGVESTQLAATKYIGPTTSLAVLGHLLRLELERHATQVVIGSPGDGQPPTWSQLDVGSGEPLPVPGRMIVFFPAGTLADVALCILINDRHWEREFTILSAAAAKETAERLLADFRGRMKSALNPLRGRVLEARVDDGSLRIGVSPGLAAERAGLMLPAPLWAEVDVFLASATTRRDLLRSLGLGTNRGLLVAGPPGVGKTHLVRVIAAELAGSYTTILADANSMRHAIADLYAESDTFGPTLVVLDDIDLVLGHRDGSGHNQSLADFLSALDGVRQREDILTVATTNDPGSLDPAAQRSNRFDTVITLPMPDAACRMRIVERHLGPLGLAIDYAEVAEALEGASGADVKEVIRRTVLEHGEAFTQDHLLDIADSGRWQAAVDRGRYLAPPSPRRRNRAKGVDA
jgi:transitional endoplasmic reticulum ATPase